MTNARTISMLGLPRTGKSTYLGALWLLMQEPAVTDLTEKDVAGDRQYLNWLAEQVAAGEEIQRTATESPDGLSLEVGFGDLGAARIEIPDLSGETITGLVERGEWRDVLGETVSRSQALMVFVHPDKIDFPVPANLTARMLEPEDQAVETALPEFTADRACTSAKLVTLLENVVELPTFVWPVPTVVVVSAWDRAQAENPADWLEMRLPGFSAMLQTNPDVVRHAVFGVSAQGGRLPNDRDELLKKDVADRVYAVDEEGNHVPLYEPLRWAVWS